jgi:hypothetical protein
MEGRAVMIGGWTKKIFMKSEFEIGIKRAGSMAQVVEC